MKSLLLSTVLFIAGTALFGQSLPVNQPKLIKLGPAAASAARYGLPNQTSSTVDTADQYITRATGGSSSPVLDGGYVFGTSYYYDSGTAAYYFVTDETGLEFDAVGNATITDL